MRNPFRRKSPEAKADHQIISKKASDSLKTAVKELEAPAVPTITHKKAKTESKTPVKKARGGVHQVRHTKEYQPLTPGRRRGAVIRTMSPALREMRNKQENIEKNTDD